MTRILALLAIAVVVVAPAFGQVDSTDHDLGSNTTSDESCVFCHTPHNATPAVPLWNHVLSTNTFTAYDSATMDALDNNDWGGGNGTISALCMSCHDGSVGLGQVLNSGSGTITDPGVMTGGAALGTDLSNDHPVNFTYDAALVTADGELIDPTTLTGPVGLFGPGQDQLECASCHDPHDDSLGDFLVATNQSSALCLTCHLK